MTWPSRNRTTHRGCPCCVDTRASTTPYTHFRLYFALTSLLTYAPRSFTWVSFPPCFTVCKKVHTDLWRLGLNVVFAAISLFSRKNSTILSELADGGPPVYFPVAPCALLSSCLFMSPSRHVQSLAGTFDNTFCTSTSVSPCAGATLPLCGRYVAITNRLHTGPRKRTQQQRSPSEPKDKTLSCIRHDSKMPTPAALSFGYRSFPLFGPFLIVCACPTMNSFVEF